MFLCTVQRLALNKYLRNQIRLPLATVPATPATAEPVPAIEPVVLHDRPTEASIVQNPDLYHWCTKAEAVATRLRDHVGVVFNYLDAVCIKYIFTRRKDDIRDEIIKISKLQQSIYRYQDGILELGGLGEEWERARDISNDVHSVVVSLEDILCWAMVDPGELIAMHGRRELRYQCDDM